MLTAGRQALQRWADSPRRRAVNEAGADMDRTGYIYFSVFFLLLLIAKTWLREGLPGLALQASTLVLTGAALATLIGHKSWGRQLYVSHREVLSLINQLHMQWVVRLTALHGLVNTIDHHGGSSLKLFVLLLGHTTALYGALAVLYTRLALPASGAVLGVMLLTSLLNGERMCRRVLESPGVEAPLADLHSLLGLAHTATAPPAISEFLTSHVEGPMQQCLAVSYWMSVVVGALLPYFLLCWLERWSSRALRAQQRGQECPEPGSEAAEGEKAEPRGWGALHFYLLSSVAWFVVCGLLRHT